MKALRKFQRGYGNLEVVEVPSPLPQEDEVVVEVQRAGVCGTDISGEIPLSEWREVFQLFEEGRGLKYLLYPVK